MGVLISTMDSTKPLPNYFGHLLKLNSIINNYVTFMHNTSFPTFLGKCYATFIIQVTSTQQLFYRTEPSTFTQLHLHLSLNDDSIPPLHSWYLIRLLHTTMMVHDGTQQQLNRCVKWQNCTSGCKPNGRFTIRNPDFQ